MTKWTSDWIKLILACTTVLTISAPFAQGQQQPPESTAVDTTAAADTTTVAPPPLHRVDYELTVPTTLADTIPPGFFRIVQNLGLNSFTTMLVNRFSDIDDSLILQALSEADQQIDYKNINAYTAAFAINLLTRQDSLWKSFFDDITMQFREPNILRFNFTDDQKWKSYALNDLFFSNFFQELLLRMGNIGIVGSRDGKQWLDGWPDEYRWKYHEYRFEYLPEDATIGILDPAHFARTDSTVEVSGVLRLKPNNPVLPVIPADSVEPPHRVPK